MPNINASASACTPLPVVHIHHHDVLLETLVTHKLLLETLFAHTLLTNAHGSRRWSSTTAAAKKAYGLRYRLLTYIYGSMSLAHRQGGTLARPLLFTDPSDLKARCVVTQGGEYQGSICCVVCSVGLL